MKIVVLDGHVLNPGDLTWQPLERLGECTIHARTPPKEVVKRAIDAEVVLTNKCLVSANTLTRLPKLRYIGVLATGHNVVDSAAARARGIPVTNVPTYGTRSVAQHTFALILEQTNRVGHHAATVDDRWARSSDWCYWDHPLVELDGLTLGIVGWGSIGREVAALGRAFGMQIIAHSRSTTEGAERVLLDDLFRRSDVVSLHCPLTPETENLVDATRLALMKPTALLVNTSRGALVNETDLAAALRARQLAGAAVDVLSAEPPRPDHPLLGIENVIITPHLAWATRAARTRLLATAAANVQAWQAGAPQNVVNP